MKNRKQIAQLLNTTERIIRDDVTALKIEPVDKGDWGKNLYCDRDVSRIQKLREHCNKGLSRETFLENTPIEVVSSEGEVLSSISEGNHSLTVNSNSIISTSYTATWQSFIAEGM